MGLNGSIEGSNPSFSVSATPRSRTPAEGWQSGRMRRSRKPLSVQADRRFKSSPLRSSFPESDAGDIGFGMSSADDRHGDAGTDAAGGDEPAHRAVGETDAAMGNRGTENASDVVEPVQSDLAGTARVLLKNRGACAQREGERRPDVPRSQLDRLLDEELTERGGRRRLPHDGLEDPDDASQP